MDELNIPLQTWIGENKPTDDMLWKDSWSNQVCFVRDEISALLCPEKYTYSNWRTIKENITVISTHTSKSIKLPVYCIKANGDIFIMRNNFHDWKVSVETHNLHKIDFAKLGISISTSHKVSSHCCEGFKSEWIYDPYDDNKFKYTIEINSNFNLKLFFWLMQKKDLIWEKK